MHISRYMRGLGDDIHEELLADDARPSVEWTSDGERLRLRVSDTREKHRDAMFEVTLGRSDVLAVLGAILFERPAPRS